MTLHTHPFGYSGIDPFTYQYTNSGKDPPIHIGDIIILEIHPPTYNGGVALIDLYTTVLKFILCPFTLPVCNSAESNLELKICMPKSVYWEARTYPALNFRRAGIFGS